MMLSEIWQYAYLAFTVATIIYMVWTMIEMHRTAKRMKAAEERFKEAVETARLHLMEHPAEYFAAMDKIEEQLAARKLH